MTPALVAKIAECFWLALSDDQTAIYTGVDRKTIYRCRAADKFCPAVKKAEIRREMIYRRRIWEGKGNWQGAAWFLERKYPTQFAKPEIQLSFNNSYTQNNLSISISGQEAKTIEVEAKPVRDKIEHMFKTYRPNGNGDEVSSGGSNA